MSDDRITEILNAGPLTYGRLKPGFSELLTEADRKLALALDGRLCYACREPIAADETNRIVCGRHFHPRCIVDEPEEAI